MVYIYLAFFFSKQNSSPVHITSKREKHEIGTTTHVSKNTELTKIKHIAGSIPSDRVRKKLTKQSVLSGMTALYPLLRETPLRRYSTRGQFHDYPNNTAAVDPRSTQSYTITSPQQESGRASNISSIGILFFIYFQKSCNDGIPRHPQNRCHESLGGTGTGARARGGGAHLCETLPSLLGEHPVSDESLDGARTGSFQRQPALVQCSPGL